MVERVNGRSSEYREIIERLREIKNNTVEQPPEKIPLIDPTANVLSLVEAAIRRQDDLRLAEARRQDDLMSQRRTHEQETNELREKLIAAEAKRIDAIRAVDVAAVATASERASQQAAVLANQVSTSAETLRTLVSSTAATVAQQLSQVSGALSERIAVLEKSQYEAKGGIGTPPPWAAGIIATVAELQQGRQRGEGRIGGFGEVKKDFFSAIAILIAVGSILFQFFMKR